MALSYLPCLIGQVQPQIDEDPVLGGLRAASSKEGRIELANGGDSKRRQPIRVWQYLSPSCCGSP